MLVENLPVPLDRRVWQESLALRDAGCDVVVVSPCGRDCADQRFEHLDGIEIHRYRPISEGGGVIGYFREYVRAYRQIKELCHRLAEERPFDVVHAANPPDFLLIAARRLKRSGARFVFDQHDLAPEVYLARFRGRRDLLYRALVLLERVSYRMADLVIATNESYAEIARDRGHVRAADVHVVRNGPDTEYFKPRPPDSRHKRGKRHVIAYVGMMGPQDGVDHALRALQLLRQRRDDWRAIFAGDGDVVPSMEKLGRELGLDDLVEFTGIVDSDEVVAILASADVCLSPEPSNPLNDASTMMKVAEYLAMGRAVVAYDLPETRATAGDAARYCEPNNVEAFADAIAELLASPELRASLGRLGRRRAVDRLDWRNSARSLHVVYEGLLTAAGRTEPGADAAGRWAAA